MARRPLLCRAFDSNDGEGGAVIMTFVKVVFLAVLLGSVSPQAEARSMPVFFSWGGETIARVMDFPNTAYYRTGDGDYVDAGVIYKQITLFFLPLWNYDVRWAGYIGSEDSYIELSQSELEEMAQHSGWVLPSQPYISGWHAYGGKLVLLAVCALVVFVARSRG